MPLTVNQVLWILLWFLSIRVLASEYKKPIVQTEVIKEKKISEDDKDLRVKVKVAEENDSIEEDLKVMINIVDESQPKTFTSEEKQNTDEEGKIFYEEFGSFKEETKEEKHGQIFRKIESSFDKLRSMQYLIVKNQLKFSDLVTCIILSYLTFVPLSTKINHAVYNPTLSRDGHLLLWQDEDIGVLRLTDVSTGITINEFFVGTKLIFDYSDGKQMYTFDSYQPIFEYAIADNHSFIIGGGETNIWIWETMSSHVVRVLTGHTAPITLCRIFRHDTRFVTKSTDGTLCVWSVTDNQALFVLRRISDCVVSADHIHIISWSTHRRMEVWNTDTGVCLHVLPVNYKFKFVAEFENPQWVGLATVKNIELWDISTGEHRITIDISRLHFISPPYICYLSKDRFVWWNNDKICISYLREYKTVDTIPIMLEDGLDILSVTVTNDNKYLVIVANDGLTASYIFTYDLNTAERIHI